jgi:methyl-accepting chemotaxis protein
MQDIQNLVTEVQKLSISIAKDSSAASKQAEELINKLVVLANEQAKELGFIGEEIKKLSESEASNMALVQGKLEEVQTYLVAVKEATDANAKDAINQIKGMPSAVVKSWLEIGEEQK